MTAHVTLVQGLGFGDEGKGSVVDYLVRQLGAHLVVRFNGGAQAAHNVHTVEGWHHTFSQFGSGTLAGAETFLSKHVIVEPLAALNEAAHLQQLLGYDPCAGLHVDEGARIVTPYHMAANRIRELLRGENRHGSCGFGIGEAVEESLNRPELVCHFEDLRHRPTLLGILMRQREYQFARLGKAFEKFLQEEQHEPNWRTMHREYERLYTVPGEFILDYEEFAERAQPANGVRLALHLAHDAEVVFEGAQGVLLDQDYGFQPHTTWSRCTWANADELLEGSNCERTHIGVSRTYATRHGAGPLVTESHLDCETEAKSDNPSNPWQDSMRTGHLDLVMLRYAAAVLGRLDGIAVTHVDTLQNMPLGVNVCRGYLTPFGGGLLSELPVPESVPSYRYQEHLGAYLQQCRPQYSGRSGSDTVLGLLESELHKPVLIASYGKMAADKTNTGKRR